MMDNLSVASSTAERLMQKPAVSRSLHVCFFLAHLLCPVPIEPVNIDWEEGFNFKPFSPSKGYLFVSAVLDKMARFLPQVMIRRCDIDCQRLSWEFVSECWQAVPSWTDRWSPEIWTA